MLFSFRNLIPFFSIALAFCEPKVDQKDLLVRVGKTTLTKQDMESYKKVSGIFPISLNPNFPGKRQIPTSLVETELLFAKNKSAFLGTIKGSDDWRWKKLYFSSQLYLMDELGENMGFTEEELKTYYNQNSKKFQIATHDSTSKDSVYIPPFDESKFKVINELFWTTYPPKQEFLDEFKGSDTDSASLKEEWKVRSQNSLQDLLMKRFYTEKYSTPYPDSINKIYGDGKIITPKDLDVILSWIPQESRERYNDPDGQKVLIEWLLKWHLFSEKAIIAGYTKTPSFKKTVDWALKIETVNQFVNKTLAQTSQEQVNVDATLLKYDYFDDYGYVATPDSSSIATITSEVRQQKNGSQLDALIYAIRQKAGVTFLQSDFKDDKEKKPAELLAAADVLRDSAKIQEAEVLYQTLSQDFSFATEGQKALIELAKIQTEAQRYTQAIQTYRTALYNIDKNDTEKLCNTFFMIGFIYDEYMENPEKAELNYKWVLENAPGCDLADDAEFMLLHLDEPMTSIEELQGEALRQNRPIDSSEEESDSAATTL